MRVGRRYLAIAMVLTLSACSAGNEDNPVEPIQPHPDEIVSIGISLPAGRSNVMRISDTVTLTATVVNHAGNRVDSGAVTWVAQRGQPLVITGPRTALLTLTGGTNDIDASIAPKYGSVSVLATISLLGRDPPPEVFLWSAAGELEKVPVPYDAEWIIPNALSDRGEIVGAVDHFHSRYTAFVWSAAAGFRVLEGDLNHDSEAKGINGSGAILGGFGDGIGGFGWPFLWKPGSIPEQIGTMPWLSSGIDINTAGHVAGQAGYDAFLWTKEHGVVFITNRSDTIHSEAIALNDNDDLLLYTGRVTQQRSSLDVPGIWNGGKLTSLGCPTCVARDINNSREVVGSLDGHAFVWRAESGVMSLAAPAGTTSEAVAINNKGDIAGWVRNGEVTQAAVWTDAGSKLVLPITGLPSKALAINNLGQVVVIRLF